jgi:hypothetical protein
LTSRQSQPSPSHKHGVAFTVRHGGPTSQQLHTAGTLHHVLGTTEQKKPISAWGKIRSLAFVEWSALQVPVPCNCEVTFVCNSSLHVLVVVTPCQHLTACVHSTREQYNGCDSFPAPVCLFGQHQRSVQYAASTATNITGSHVVLCTAPRELQPTICTSHIYPNLGLNSGTCFQQNICGRTLF